MVAKPRLRSIPFSSQPKDRVGLYDLDASQKDFHWLWYYPRSDGFDLGLGFFEHVGLLKIAASVIKEVSGGNFFIALSIILWISAFGSSIVDNVPFAVTMTPILKHMSEAFGFPPPPLI